VVSAPQRRAHRPGRQRSESDDCRTNPERWRQTVDEHTHRSRTRHSARRWPASTAPRTHRPARGSRCAPPTPDPLRQGAPHPVRSWPPARRTATFRCRRARRERRRPSTASSARTPRPSRRGRRPAAQARHPSPVGCRFGQQAVRRSVALLGGTAVSALRNDAEAEWHDGREPRREANGAWRGAGGRAQLSRRLLPDRRSERPTAQIAVSGLHGRLPECLREARVA